MDDFEIRIRTKPHQKELIEHKAEMLGLPVSAFVRMAALRFRIPGASTLQEDTPGNLRTGDPTEQEDR